MTRRMPLLALKIDSDTLRGTREGVPRLAQLLRGIGAQATFLFSVGPDHTGRALRRIVRPGFLSKVSRTSVIEHYGIRTLLYGTLLPGPHIGRACAAEMRSVQTAGFEVGLHAYDHVLWQDCVAQRDARWTARELQRGMDAFEEVFGAPPKVHGAAGWQMNACAFELERVAGFDYCSDTRGTRPFVPKVDSEGGACVQIPTTLPTLDELIGIDGMTAQDAVSRLLSLTAADPSRNHVFTLHAELEGMRLLPLFSALLQGWKAQGYELVAMRSLFESAARTAIPVHAVLGATIPGRSGTVMTQGDAVERADRSLTAGALHAESMSSV